MSTENYLICHKARLPDSATFVAALEAQGLPLVFEADFNPRNGADRYVACQFAGRSGGFDFAARPYEDDMFHLSPAEAAQVGDRDVVMQFSTFSGVQEAACAAIVSALLAQLTDGVLLAGREEAFIQGPAALDWLLATLPGEDAGVPRRRLRVNGEG